MTDTDLADVFQTIAAARPAKMLVVLVAEDNAAQIIAWPPEAREELSDFAAFATMSEGADG